MFTGFIFLIYHGHSVVFLNVVYVISALCLFNYLGHNVVFLQVEAHVRKLYCINRAVPNLPFNIEDAARSEVEFEKAKPVHFLESAQVVVL